MAASDRPFAVWIRSHADVVRFAGPIVAVVLLFFVGLSWVSVIVLGALVVLYELGMRSSRRQSRCRRATCDVTV